MNLHLSDLELTDYLLGAGSEASEIHMQSCPACRSELTRVSESIQLFRTAAIGWSVNQQLEKKREAMPVRAWLNRPLLIARWVMSAALVCFVFIVGFHFKNYQIPGWQSSSERGTTTDTAAFQTEIEKDNELLSHLNRELSKNVPAPMQPLQISRVTETENNGR